MNLGADILAAVKSGGIANRTTTTNNHPFGKRRKNETDYKLDKVYNSIKGMMTSAEIAKAAGYKLDTTYKYLIRLMGDGKVVRTQRGQPYSYRRK